LVLLSFHFLAVLGERLSRALEIAPSLFQSSRMIIGVSPPVSAHLLLWRTLQIRFLGERLLAQFLSRLQKLVTESRAGHRSR
jgi:hypothetical protein